MTVELFLQLLAVPLCGVLDRVRGDPWHIANSRFADKVCYGFILAMAGGNFTNPAAMFCITVAMVIGMSAGWGEPFSAVLLKKPMDPAKLEWWQKGPLARNAKLSLAFRGFMWGAPLIPFWQFVGWHNVILYIVAFTIAMPASMPAAKLALVTDDIWARVEIARGFMAGVILAVGSNIINVAFL